MDLYVREKYFKKIDSSNIVVGKNLQLNAQKF